MYTLHLRAPWVRCTSKNNIGEIKELIIISITWPDSFSQSWRLLIRDYKLLLKGSGPVQALVSFLAPLSALRAVIGHLVKHTNFKDFFVGFFQSSRDVCLINTQHHHAGRENETRARSFL